MNVRATQTTQTTQTMQTMRPNAGARPSRPTRHRGSRDAPACASRHFKSQVSGPIVGGVPSAGRV
ncbi:hypothetical protein WS86_13980 [Burkholderia savannae]|uniref:Uncharacterized protein n=1 Tax=Burkholderia savannae TaxID=1637837 RepID=A0ABR5TIW9_9BURK|nr:hypothetical protein WS86_13980 [Burkholderia savannae]KWZ43829.1 hypothetical protein WS72_13825 [Burkholderia savannae]